MLLPVLLAASLISAPSDLPSHFVDLLERDDFVAVVAAAVPEADFGDVGYDLLELRETVQKYDCIDVRAMEAVPLPSAVDAKSFRLTLAATAVTSGAVKREAVLPRDWFVTFARMDGNWRLRSAKTLESQVADAMIAAPDDAARWRLAGAQPLDLTALANHMNYRFEDPAMWPFVRDLASSTADRVVSMRANASAASILPPGPARSECLETALRIARESKDADALVRAHFAEAILTMTEGDAPAAIEVFNRAASRVDDTTDARPPLKSLFMAKYLLLFDGNLIAGAALAQRELELSRKYGWLEGEGNAQGSLASIHRALGNRTEAMAATREALRIALAIGRRDAASSATLGVADDAMNAGRYAEARAHYARAAELWDAAKGSLDWYMAALTARQGRLEEAEQHYRVALERVRKAGDRSAEATLLVELSKLATQRRQFGEALRLVREARLIPQEGVTIHKVLPPELWNIRLAEGLALAGLGRRTEAAAALEEAIAAIETDKRSVSGDATPAFFAGKTAPFMSLLRLRIEDRALTDALVVSERMKARVLHDVMSRGHVDLRAALTEEERAREEEIDRRLVELNRAIVAAGPTPPAALREALEKARLEQRAFEIQLQLSHPELRRAASPPGADDVRRWLDQSRLVPQRDAAVLDYVVGEKETYLFVLTRGPGGTEVSARTLPIAGRDLARSVERLLAQIERRDLGYAAAAEQLYGQLIAPAESLLAGRKRICVVPHGPLWQLPFAVLRTPNGKHLIERASIHYAPSLAFLDLTADAAETWLPEKPILLAFGNPALAAGSVSRIRAYTRATLGNLPEAAIEARTVGALYGDTGANVLVEAAATEEAFKSLAAERDILHFATHGISQPALPLYSCLVLAAGSEHEDGLIEAREIARMNLRAQLAVLSACESARGAIAEGEGVIGLSWAFLVAGCPRTIVTQWRTDSDSAAKAMIRFHRVVAGSPGGGSVADALRAAQLELLRTPRHSHPYYWGGFVAVGAGW